MSTSLPLNTGSATGSVSFKPSTSTDGERRYFLNRLQRAFWKDFRAVMPMLLVIVLGTVGLQALMVAIWDYSDPVKAQALFPLSYIVILTPFVILLGCSGLLIGGERENQSWNWCSSLPIDWRIALLSKLTVTLVASLLASLLVSAIPFAVGQVSQALGFSENFTTSAMVTSGILVWFQLLMVSYFCVLLFREAMTALLIAAGVLIACQLTSIAAASKAVVYLENSFSGFANNSEYSRYLLYLLMNCLLLASFAILMIASYRWRWYIGQNSNWPSGRSLLRRFTLRERLGRLKSSRDSQPSVKQLQLHPAISSASGFSYWQSLDNQAALSIIEQKSRYQLLSQPHPWPFRTELWLAFRSQWAMSLAVITLPVTIALAERGQVKSAEFWAPELALMLSWLAIAILGSLTFAGEQSRGRYRFLAERGAIPDLFWVTRLLVSWLVVITLVSVVSVLLQIKNGDAGFIGDQGMAPTHFMRISPAYFGMAVLSAIWMLGVLASICFRRPIMSATATVLIILGFANLWGLTKIWWQNIIFAPNLYPNFSFLRTYILGLDTQDNPFSSANGIHSVVLCIFIASLLIQWLIVLRLVVKRWLVWESPRLEFIFLFSVPFVLLTSLAFTFFVTATFGFLAFPSYAEKELRLLSTQEIVAVTQQELYDLSELISSANDLAPTSELTVRLLEDPLDQHKLSGEFTLKSVCRSLENVWICSSVEKVDTPVFSSITKTLTDPVLFRLANNEISLLESSLEKPLRKPTSDYQFYLISIQHFALRAAAIGKLAAQAGELELSRRALQTVREIIAHPSIQLTIGPVLKGRVWCILSQLSESEIHTLGGPDVVRQMLPEKEDWNRHYKQMRRYSSSLKLRWIESAGQFPSDLAERTGLRDHPMIVRYYPPIRWLMARSVIQSYVESENRTSYKNLVKELKRNEALLMDRLEKMEIDEAALPTS